MQVSRILLPVLSAMMTAWIAPAGLTQTLPRTIAQAGYPPCQPSAAKEYLLLVISRTPEVQAQVRSLLPTNAKPTVCLYRTDIVTRVGGFTSLDAATAWSKYLNENVGLQAFVIKPTGAASPPPAPQPPSTTYNPQRLTTGYVVLVNYFNQPEIATEVKQLLNQEVGLAAYGQRPFLVAMYTTDPTLANTALQKLTDRGYSALIVDGRQVMLLRSIVQY
jgi:hypothetical protein